MARLECLVDGEIGGEVLFARGHCADSGGEPVVETVRTWVGAVSGVDGGLEDLERDEGIGDVA